MKKKDTAAIVGRSAFIIGVILAIVSGFFELGSSGISALVILGLIVGILNITEKESKTFILLSVALVVVAGFSADLLASVDMIGTYLSSSFMGIIAFITPATIIVGLKEIYTLAKD